MHETVTIVPYGSLRSNIPESAADSLDQPLEGARSLTDVLATIGVPVEAVQLVMINHRAASIDTAIHAGDRIALFPKEYPIFVDWHTYRTPTNS